MTEDSQEYLQIWEKENNPFYPEEMCWDRLKVNNFLKDYKQQLQKRFYDQKKADCEHKRVKYCLQTGGGKCRDCGAI